MFVPRTIEAVLPDPPPGYSSLPHWLSEVTDSKLKKLLEQRDFQRVRELSLALITVLNEVCICVCNFRHCSDWSLHEINPFA